MNNLSINYVPIISKQIYLAFIAFLLKKNEPGNSEFSEEEDGINQSPVPPKKIKVEREKIIHDKLLDFIIATNQPFSIVNNPELKAFVKY